MDKKLATLFEKYYLYTPLPMSDSNPEKYILSYNDKYLKLSKDNLLFWNVFDLLGIDYYVSRGLLYIKKAPSSLQIHDHSQVCLINNHNPFKELIEKRDSYQLLLKFKNRMYLVSIKTPEVMYNNEDKNLILRENNNLFIKFQNVNGNLEFSRILNTPVENLIIDLSGNSGGSVKNAILFLEHFIPYKANIVYFKSRHNDYKVTCSNKMTISPKCIHVLIDHHTLSSAELIAKALKVKCNAKIYGSSSGGKNIVTNTFKYKSYYIKIPQFIYYFNDDVDASPRLSAD